MAQVKVVQDFLLKAAHDGGGVLGGLPEAQKSTAWPFVAEQQPPIPTHFLDLWVFVPVCARTHTPQQLPFVVTADLLQPACCLSAPCTCPDAAATGFTQQARCGPPK